MASMLVIGYDLKIFIKDFGKDKKLIYLCIQIQTIMTQSIKLHECDDWRQNDENKNLYIDARGGHDDLRYAGTIGI